MQSKSEYISYEPAIAQLRKRLGATQEVTPEELAAWIFISTSYLCVAEIPTVVAKNDGGKKYCKNEVLHLGDKCELHGGLSAEAELIEHKRHNLEAFTDAGELDPPPRFFFGNYAGERDYLPLLYRCWFKADDIATFEPGDRYITGEKLLERWAVRNVIPPLERIKIASRESRPNSYESRLNPIHPTLGLTQATFPDADYAPLEDGLFSLADVKAYEREEFGGEIDATGESGDAAGKGEAGAIAAPTKTKMLAQTWWRTEYEIMTMAQSAGDSLRRKGKRTSNRAIGDAVALEIEQREKSGKKRKGPDGQTIKNADLLGWKYEAE